jgi:Ca2+-dependent lipid-binding protein
MFTECSLNVVDRCTNLPGTDLAGSIDPYVEVVMRNHPVNARTKTAKGKHPVFEECYQFLVFNPASDLNQPSHIQRFSRECVLKP